MIGGLAYSQIGINTDMPRATLDVMAIPADLTKTDGFIAPRLKGSELKAKDGNYTILQTGAIVYITEALIPTDTTPKTVNVTAVGYFYFDGSIWQKMAADLRMVGTNHITQDAGNGSNGTSVGTGLNNIAIGKDALMSNTTGVQNIAIGVNALKSNTTGRGNLVISNSDGTFESSGGSNTTGNYNLVLGGDAFTANTSGEYNVAIGGASLFENTTGNYNTAIGGLWTMGQNTTGIMNTAVGVEALTSMTVGVGNTAIGTDALYNFIGDNNTNSVGNIGLGYNSGNNLKSGKNNILIGLNAEAKVSPTGSNQLNIGNWIYGDNGKIGLGTATIPTNTLHISGGTTNPVRFEGLKPGLATDKIVVVDTTGVLKTVTTASLSAADFNFSSLPTYANDSAAAAGNLAAGKLYKTATGEIRIKL
ncbi:hypothetical protein GCM10022217_10910 [Chryseobacterium ginsenosidimutans]